MTNIMRLSYPGICHGNSQEPLISGGIKIQKSMMTFSSLAHPGHMDREKTPMLYSLNLPQSPEAQQSVLIYVKAVKRIISIDQGMGQHPTSLLF
jgi:hypothetical protein